MLTVILTLIKIVYCRYVGLSRQRSMVQASTAALLFFTEDFELCTCSSQGHFPEMGQARIETNVLFNY